VHQAGQGGDETPTDENARYPNPRSDFVHQDVARDLKDHVTEKEDASDEAKLSAGDGQFLVHRQGRKADVDAVNKGGDVEDKQKRQNPEPDFSGGSRFYGQSTLLRC
jgi:hypothetical protein